MNNEDLKQQQENALIKAYEEAVQEGKLKNVPHLYSESEMNLLKQHALLLLYRDGRYHPTHEFTVPMGTFDNIADQIERSVENTNGDGKVEVLTNKETFAEYNRDFILKNMKSVCSYFKDDLVLDDYDGEVIYITTNRPVTFPVFIDVPPIAVQNIITFIIRELHQTKIVDGKLVETSEAYISFIALKQHLTGLEVRELLDPAICQPTNLFDIVKITFSKVEKDVPID
jgi:hypothetical protein